MRGWTLGSPRDLALLSSELIPTCVSTVDLAITTFLPAAPRFTALCGTVAQAGGAELVNGFVPPGVPNGSLLNCEPVSPFAGIHNKSPKHNPIAPQPTFAEMYETRRNTRNPLMMNYWGQISLPDGERPTSSAAVHWELRRRRPD
jgi:hypothetical protein